MLVMVLWANLVGGLLPLILTKFKLDPAVISSPFMATLIDFTGIIIYFNLSIFILGL
jgi:magnesium transporter